MSVFKTTFSRALSVIKSDDNVIPSPSLLISSRSTSGGTNLLIDTNANFIVTTPTGVQYKVNVGDVVYNYDTGLSATIVQVVSNSRLLLSADNIVTTLEYYSIYQQGAQTGLGNTGAFLYVGGAGNLSVVTLGGDEVIFNGVPAGTTLPIQVTKLKATGTTATNVIALW